MTEPIDTAHVEIVPDLDRFAAQLKRELDRAFKGLAANLKDSIKVAPVKVPLEADDDALDRSLRKTRARVGDEGRQAGLGYRVGFSRGFASRLGGIFAPLGESIPLVGAIGKSMGGQLILSLKLAAVAGVAQLGLELVNALAPLVGTVALLPAVAVGAAVAFGTLKLAMSGVGDALKAGLSGDTAKLAEAMKGLAPSAQAAVKAMVALKPAMDALKKTVQQAFFVGFDKTIRDLAAVTLPTLNRALVPLAASFNLVGRQIGAMFTSAGAVAALDDTLDDLGRSIGNAAGFLPGFLRGMLDLTQVGATFMPALTSGFRDAGEAFAAFIARTQESGQLREFISGGLSAVGELFEVLQQVGSILVSVFRAVGEAGGGLLGVLGDLLAHAAAFLKTAEGMAALQAVFGGLAVAGNALGEALARILPAIGGVLVTLAPLLGRIVETLAPALAAAVEAIAPLLGLFDFVEPLAEAIAPLVPLVGQLAAVLGGGLALVISALMPALTSLAETLDTAIRPILPVIADLFTTLASIIGKIATVLASILAPVLLAVSDLLVELGPVLNEVAVVIGDVLLAALTELQPLFAALATAIAEWARDLFPALIPLVQQLGLLLLALLPALGPLVDLMVVLTPHLIAMSQGFKVTIPVVTFLAQVITFLVEAAVGLTSAIAGVVVSFVRWLGAAETLGGGLSGIWASITGAISTAVGVITGLIGSVVGFFQALPGRIWTALTALPGLLRQAASAAFDAFFFAIGFGIGTVIGFFRALPGRIIGAVSALSGLLSGLFRSAVATVTSIVSSGVSAVVSFFASLPGRAWSAISSLPGRISSLFSSAMAAGRAIVTAGINAIVSLVASLPGRAASALSSIGGAIRGALAGAGGWLVSAGHAIIDGLIGGVKAAVGRAISAVKNAMGSIVAGAKKALGIGSPSKVFAGIAADSVAGYLQGINRNAAAAKRVTADLLTPPAAPAFAGAGGRGPGGFSLGGITVTMTFAGAVPTADEARRAGVAAAAGIADELARRTAPLQLRSL